MAHAARVENGIVTEVIVVPDDLDETESDAAIQEFCDSLGLEGTWLRTSYNHNIRGMFAGVGYLYDSDADEFVLPQIAGLETDEAP